MMYCSIRVTFFKVNELQLQVRSFMLIFYNVFHIYVEKEIVENFSFHSII